ncbi:MAG: SRPBCC family protein [Flavobacteriales bacterium]|jgi:ligand-binding SRPBCC domain-containing protein|nr:SRPBCC family protein [Flavobacteriales bacterium]
MPLIELETEINAPIKIVFDLSRSIDLHKISTKHTNEKAIAGITTGLINKNESVTWKAKHFGVYQTLTSKITELEIPNYFVDEMEKGIFKSFKHQHIFKESKNKTLMIDIFDYKLPLGLIGKFADILFLEKYIKSFLKIRNQTIKEYAESDKWRNILN